jgi:hypothetical protein
MGAENLAPGFDLWTAQPVASRYTDYTVPLFYHHKVFKVIHILLLVEYFMQKFVMSEFNSPFVLT